jgi:hypothetical protein
VTIVDTRLCALEARRGIVQDARPGFNAERSVWYDLRSAPAMRKCPVDDKEMICVGLELCLTGTGDCY